ncbi:uncharacterized protein EI90DRAFT_3288117 [Cantharellus anzutake]|uniref:uncharacterized protein n=1 Tax=Cantharellus anzutake TaxID=1750568 RepID=UPI001903AE1F|nr:uncharacterized protein EI90DRAFT_3288117 [Cantharellus anzutake]KAF8334600.1 hypothetical protein EI90DRAFT_3288117 [Cantharellus anzutake]
MPLNSSHATGASAPSSINGVQNQGNALFLTIVPPTHRGRRQGSSPAKPPRPKKYPCPQCGLMFDRPCSVKTHVYSHTGEKPFPCDYCNSAFPTKSNLYRHRKTCKNYKKCMIQGGRSRQPTRSQPGATPQNNTDEHQTKRTSTPTSTNSHLQAGPSQTPESIVHPQPANAPPGSSPPSISSAVDFQQRQDSRSPLDSQQASRRTPSAASSESSGMDLPHPRPYFDNGNTRPRRGFRYGSNLDYPTDSAGGIGSAGVSDDAYDHPDRSHNHVQGYYEREYLSPSPAMESRGAGSPVHTTWVQPGHDGAYNAANMNTIHRPRSDHTYASSTSGADVGRDVSGTWNSGYYASRALQSEPGFAMTSIPSHHERPSRTVSNLPLHDPEAQHYPSA